MTGFRDVGDKDVLDAFPSVRLDHDNKHWYKGLLSKQLVIHRCDDCGRWYLPASFMCPSCWSTRTTPTPVSGRGRVDLVTFLHQGPPAPGVDYSKPYPLVGVELDEQPGLRVSSTIVQADYPLIRRGLPVTVAWIERASVPYPAFEPVDGGTSWDR